MYEVAAPREDADLAAVEIRCTADRALRHGPPGTVCGWTVALLVIAGLF
jgi:hypothetical protein